MISETTVRQIRNVSSLFDFLREELSWQLPADATIDDVTFDWTGEDLRLRQGASQRLSGGLVRQLRPFHQDQPWGIFLVDFNDSHLYRTVLRQVLRRLVPNRRQDPSRPAWHHENLLFICTTADQQFTFAHFRGEKRQRAKLITFSWSPDDPIRTLCEFNLPALRFPQDGGQDREGWLRQWQSAFDVEKVTEQFFADYQHVFEELQNLLHGQTKDPVWAHDYALHLLNRLLFLYFIQRKRWLGDNPRFIRRFWDAYKETKQAKDRFFADWLLVLFFEAFNERFQAGRSDRRHFPPDIGDALANAPYLNGGLFAPNELDEKYDVAVPDDFLETLFDKFNGLKPGFLERYNFTIREDSPFDQEVAVDPEMIGKVYESLVNITFKGIEKEDLRGTAGIFYTPRIEIDLMCRLSLVDWLANNLGEERKPLLYEAIFAYDPEEKHRADEALSRDNLWAELDRLLREIAVLDPACGSGSFLVGMLAVLDDLQARSHSYLGVDETPLQRRKRIIGQSLYGVDVMPWAVHVAELRLWLQLVVETELHVAELKFRPLLPNLSFKVRPGDSLVQEVAGISLALSRAHLENPRELKGRLTRLKGEKLKFYNNDSTGRFRSEADLKHEELRLFRDILRSKSLELTNEINKLTRRIESPHPNQLSFQGLERRKAELLSFFVEKWRREREASQQELGRVREAFDALRTAQDVPFAWDIAFVEIFEGEKGGFDVVLGNPPYVRQERIAPPLLREEDHRADQWRELKIEYKAKLRQSIAATYPRFFRYKPKADKFRKLDGKSDLYIYFYLHGLSLLNAKGSFCFITSNSWLDVGYGKDLQEFLLKHSHVKMIIDNQAMRTFKQADVNTIIALLAPPDDRKIMGFDRAARFITFKAAFEEILSPVIFHEVEKATAYVVRPEFRVIVRSQGELYEEGLTKSGKGKQQEAYAKRGRKVSGPLIRTARYEGNKWGGKYLRAPQIYYVLLERLQAVGRPLADFVWGQRYLNTGGADGFFILSEFETSKDDEYYLITNVSKEGRASGHPQFLIERDFLRPAVKSTNIPGLVVTNPDALVLDIPANTPHLSRKKVWHYIKWGESAGFNRRSVTSLQTPWWKAPRQARESGPLLIMRNYNDVHKSFYNPKRYVAVRFYRFYPHNGQHEKPLIAILNSTYFALLKEIYGSTKLGQGALDMTMADMMRVPIPFPFDPKRMQALAKAFDNLSQRRAGNVAFERNQPDRRALDEIVFDALRLTAGEQEAVYDAVLDLVKRRLEKARSL